MIIDPRFREVDEPVVNVQMSLSQANAVQGALSDVLCWIRGWRAGASKSQLSNDPIGTETLRELNIKMKREIERVEK